MAARENMANFRNEKHFADLKCLLWRNWQRGRRIGMAGIWVPFFCPLVSVQLLSHVWLSVTPWTAAHQASLSFTIYQSLLKLMSIESVMPSIQLILCRPLLHLPSIFPSIRVFSNELTVHVKWPKYWSFSISASKEYSGLISFRNDCLDLCCSRDSQGSSSAPQLESINSLVLSRLYGPTLTSVQDYWKKT